MVNALVLPHTTVLRTWNSKLVRVLPKRILVDPVFGTLTYQRVGFWEGRLAVGDKHWSICVEADEAGPRDHQRDTANFVRRESVALLAIAKTFAKNEATSKLEVESASFEREEGVWEVVLITESDSLFYCVRLQLDRPLRWWVDG